MVIDLKFVDSILSAGKLYSVWVVLFPFWSAKEHCLVNVVLMNFVVCGHDSICRPALLNEDRSSGMVCVHMILAVGDHFIQ